MQDTPASKPPVHFWIVAVLAVLWNAGGVFDYLATQIPLESYMSAFSEEQLAYFNGLPTWAVACWALATHAALLASLAMLFRLRWAYHLFILSLVALLASSFHSLVLTNGAEIMGTAGVIFSIAIIAIAIFLVFYGRAMLQRGVLR